MSDAPASASPGTVPGDAPAGRYGKTEAGRAEIRNRALPLSRPARNLLLIIDPSRDGAHWLGVVHGCGPAELAALCRAGLVVEAAATPAGADGAVSAAGRMSLAQALQTKAQQVLYQRITAQARPRLGLLKGYRLILDLERCNGPAETRALAQRFVEQVRAADGDAAAIALAQVLIAPD